MLPSPSSALDELKKQIIYHKTRDIKWQEYFEKTGPGFYNYNSPELIGLRSEPILPKSLNSKSHLHFFLEFLLLVLPNLFLKESLFFQISKYSLNPELLQQ